MATFAAMLSQQAAEASAAAGGWLAGIDGDQRFVLTIIAIGCATAVVVTLGCVAAALWSTVQRRRSEMDLKREMLDRGMSADEIAKVIEAAAPPEDGFGRWLASYAKKR